MRLKVVYPVFIFWMEESTLSVLEIFTNKGIGTAIKNQKRKQVL